MIFQHFFRFRFPGSCARPVPRFSMGSSPVPMGEPFQTLLLKTRSGPVLEHLCTIPVYWYTGIPVYRHTRVPGYLYRALTRFVYVSKYSGYFNCPFFIF